MHTDWSPVSLDCLISTGILLTWISSCYCLCSLFYPHSPPLLMPETTHIFWNSLSVVNSIFHSPHSGLWICFYFLLSPCGPGSHPALPLYWWCFVYCDSSPSSLGAGQVSLLYWLQTFLPDSPGPCFLSPRLTACTVTNYTGPILSCSHGLPPGLETLSRRLVISVYV